MKWLKEYEEKARELHEQRKLTMISRGEYHVAFKVLGDDRVYVRYVCPKCGNKEELHKELKFPYKLKCSRCRYLVWESKLRRQRGRKKRGSPVLI
ncbi:MAG TPA: hypothetical protein ENF51_00250 [Candidatus Aenigmarchaeota archaeon]|nr:hypothetical protein [Candidatus Aenigmarchaeota archaeon]